jgi:hypothetical protein
MVSRIEAMTVSVSVFINDKHLLRIKTSDGIAIALAIRKVRRAASNGEKRGGRVAPPLSSP